MTQAAGVADISDRLLEIAARDPGRELVIDPVYGRFTYGQVADQVDRLAGGLRGLDFEPGDVVVLQLPNWAPFMVVHIALTAIGAVTATIPIVYRERELREVLRLTGAKGIVVPAVFRGHDYAAMVEAVRADAPDLQQVILAGVRFHTNHLSAARRAVGCPPPNGPVPTT
jgi:non-ribosomal peptide synthetase component E (peptide arylation enzyme)